MRWLKCAEVVSACGYPLNSRSISTCEISYNHGRPITLIAGLHACRHCNLDRAETGHGLQLLLDVPPITDDNPHPGASLAQTTYNLINVFMGIGSVTLSTLRTVACSQC
jgi:hypothetical protein